MDKVANNERYFASKMAVLKAAGFTDWKMYSRYDWLGIGDLSDGSWKVSND